MMQYAIDTLLIELYKCKSTIRVTKHYSAHPEYTEGHLYNDFVGKLLEIEKAILILQQAKEDI